jgi:hypothetical protein
METKIKDEGISKIFIKISDMIYLLAVFIS